MEKIYGWYVEIYIVEHRLADDDVEKEGPSKS